MMKSKNRSWAKVLASVAMGGVILSGLAIGNAGFTEPLITKASAGVDGGGSTGGGGGGGGGQGRWMEIPKAKLDNGSIQNIPAQYRNSAICQNAIAYFAIVPNVVSDGNATGGPWTYSFYGVGTGNGVNFPGGSNVATRIAQNVGWSYDQGAAYLNQKNFICLDNPNVVVSNEWRYEVRDTGNSSDSLNETGVHSISTTVTPQPIEGVLDPIGEKNLNTQGGVVANTNFGNVFEEYQRAVSAPGADRQNIVGQFKARFAEARAQDAAKPRENVTLNEGNQAGLAEGGILNVTERTKSATATASTSANSRQVWRCGWDNWSKSGWQPTGCEAVGGSINPDNLDTAGKNYARWDSQGQRDRYNPPTSGPTSWTNFSTRSSSDLTTLRTTGFWQILAAHCNAQGMVDLKNAMGADLVDLGAGDSTNQVSALVRTKVYPSQPTVLPLGQDSSSLSAAQRATSKIGFFDKECPFDCTPNRSTAAGASEANGAVSNVSSDALGAPAVKGLTGAKSSDNVNSNYTETFRDNIERDIRPDVWYPVSGSNGVSYDGSAPKSTMVTRWAGGTPKLQDEFKASLLTRDKDGKETSRTPIFSLDGSSTTQKNNFGKPSENFSNSSGSQVTGLADHIGFQATWASTKDKPQAIQVAWEYAPNVTSTVPRVISFTQGGTGAQVVSSVSRVTKVDGRCWGEFGTSAQTTRALAATELKSNTGTGTTPKFTVPNGSEKAARNIVLNFVRGTGE